MNMTTGARAFALGHEACLIASDVRSDGGSMNGTGLKGLFRQIFALPTGLTERQQQLIRASFERVLPVQETVVTLFYERLFRLDPRSRLCSRARLMMMCFVDGNVAIRTRSGPCLTIPAKPPRDT